MEAVPEQCCGSIRTPLRYDKKSLAKALSESEDRFFKAFHSSPNIMCITTLNEGRIVDINEAAGRILGYERGDILGIFNLTTDTRSDPSHKVMIDETIRKGGSVRNVESTIMSKTGEQIPVIYSGEPILLDDELHLLSIASDITDKKNTEIALRLSEQTYSHVIDQSNESFILIKDGIVTYANKKSEVLTGFPNKEMVGQNFLNFVAPSYRAKVGEIYLKRLRGEEVPSRYEIETVNKDGTNLLVEVSASIISWSTNKVDMVMMRDITDKRRAEEQRALHAKVLSILNRPNEWQNLLKDLMTEIKGFTGYDAVGIRIKKGEDYPYSVSNGFSEHFLSQENTLFCEECQDIKRLDNGKPMLVCTCGMVLGERPPGKNPLFTEYGSFYTNDTEVLVNNPGDPRFKPRDNCHKEGYRSVALIPLWSGDTKIGILQMNDRHPGKFTPDLIKFFEEIGNSIGIAFKRRRMEETVREKDEKNRSLIENLADAVVEIDDKNFVVYSSPQIKELLGYDAEWIVGRDFSEFVQSDDFERCKEASSQVLRDKQIKNFEFKMRHSNGTYRHINLSGRLVESKDGKRTIVAVIRDMTEKLEAQMRIESEKKRAEFYLDLLSHDIGNLHQAMQAWTSIAHSEKTDHDLRKTAIGKLVELEKRSTRLVKNVLLLSRLKDMRPDLKKIDIVPIVRKVTEDIKAGFADRDIIIGIEMNEPSIPIMAEPVVEEVFFNLLHNGVKFQPDNHAKLDVVLLKDENVVFIEISDHGAGITDEQKNNLFDRHVKGSSYLYNGIGLSLVKELVTRYDGSIEVMDRVAGKSDKGAKFRLTFPVV